MNIRLMSHNVWGMFAPDVVHEVANRAELMTQVYLEHLPDVIGTQEFSQDIRRHNLPQMISSRYRELDVSADIEKYGMKNLFTPVFYRPDTCEPINAGFQLYNRLYNNQDSKGVTWAVFRHLADGKVFSVCNTHYWWKGGQEHDLARVGNSEEVLAIKERLPTPFFVMGDLNCIAASAAYQKLVDNGLSDIQLSAPKTSNRNTHHPYPQYNADKKLFFGAPEPVGDYQKAIDHMFVDAEHTAGLVRFEVITDCNALNTSDHCPILVDYSFSTDHLSPEHGIN